MNSFMQNKAKFSKIELLYVLVIQAVTKMNPHFWPNFPKAKFFANALNVSYGKLKCYEMNLDFWPKNPKAKTNPNKAKTKPNKPNFLEGNLNEF